MACDKKYEKKPGDGSAFKNNEMTEDWHFPYTGEIILPNGDLHYLNIKPGKTKAGEHWFQVNFVWERYNWLDDCDLFYRGGLSDITKIEYLESLANNTTALITVPYTSENGKVAEKIELVNMNDKWLTSSK